MSVQRYHVGDRIRGDHRVLSVERGFLGIVYICRQRLPGGKKVYKAIKTFRHDDDQVSRELFEAELAHWVQLEPHPNIVQARDADTVNMQLVLEFVPGPNLREVAFRSPLHPRHFLLWARQIAAGLRFLHEDNHFLHRDLRPANVLIDTAHGLTAKISDMGLGKPFDPMATSHTVIGTFTYMAPEVYRAKTDFRSDIFSYGATLYYLLTGRNAVKLSTKDLKSVKTPRHIVADLPGELADLVLGCMRPDPSERVQTMSEVLSTLEGLEEWPTDETAYLRCGEHEFSYYEIDASAKCPFCLHARKMADEERELDKRLGRS